MAIAHGKGGKLIGVIKCIAGEVTPTREEYKMCCELSKCMHSADCILGDTHMKLLLSFGSQFLIERGCNSIFLFTVYNLKVEVSELVP